MTILTTNINDWTISKRDNPPFSGAVGMNVPNPNLFGPTGRFKTRRRSTQDSSPAIKTSGRKIIYNLRPIIFIKVEATVVGESL